VSMIRALTLVFVIVLLVAVAGVVGYFVHGVIGSPDTKPSAPHLAERTNQLPTATEVFDLRSRCVALGEKIMENNAIGSALTQWQNSHYNPVINRCHVELIVQSANKSIPYQSQTMLYDGQTGELLATFQVKEDGVRFGMVYDRHHKTKSWDNLGYDDARAYVDKLMEENREQ
jgi:hypothetical protein